MADIIIIGAGHNALVSACYLAKAGHKVLMLEQAPQTGGLCINERMGNNHTISAWANWSGMLRPEIIVDLDLSLEYSAAPSFSVLVDAQNGLINNQPFGQAATAENINAIEKMEDDLTSLSRALNRFALHPHPQKQAYLSEADAQNLTFPAAQILSSSMIGLARAYGLSGIWGGIASCESFVHPAHPGGVYGAVYMGLPQNYPCGGWGYIKGGMGRITQELERRARALGVEIRTNTQVQQIDLNKGIAESIVLQDGSRITADHYICGTDYGHFLSLTGQDGAPLRMHKTGTANIHVELKDIPVFPALVQNGGVSCTPTMTLTPAMEDLESQYPDYLAGRLIENPVISLGFPDMAFPETPETGGVMCIHADHSPISHQNDWDAVARQHFADHIFQAIERHAPSFRDCVGHYEVYTPKDLEVRHNALHRHCFHADHVWGHAFEDRIPGIGAGPQTPWENLSLCSAICHPGGTVSGAPGYRCAQAVVKSLAS